MNAQIKKTAKEFQTLSRQQKELDAKIKPLKDELLNYAKDHKEDFDEAFQLKFPNGTYISHRVKDALIADKKAKESFLEETGDEYVKFDLNEKQVLENVPKNSRLKKLLTKLGITVGQKETFAIYAG